MTKRIIASLLALCLILSAVPAFAGAAAGPQVSAGNMSVTAGNSVTVTLKAEDFTPVSTLEVYVYYDPAVLTLTGTGNGTLLSGAQSSVNTAEAGTVKLVTMSLNGISGTGNLLSLYFKTESDCAPGTYPIKVAIGNAYDTSFGAVSIGAVNGSVTVTKPVATETFTIYGYPSVTTLQKGDVLSYRVASASSSREFVSGEFVVEYDHEVFAFDSASLESALTGEGAFYSINSSVLGQVRIAYASENPVKSFYLFTVKLKVIADVDSKTTVKAQVSNMYREDLSMYLPDDYTSTLTLQKLPQVADDPNAFLQTDRLVVGEQSKSVFTLEAGAGVAAADFTLTYDPAVLRCVGVEMAEGLEEKGGMLVINDNFAAGKIKFSYVNMDAYSAEDLPLVQILWEPLQSPQTHYAITSTGVGVVDKQQNPITLEYISHSGCVFVRTVVPPTCLEDGYTEDTCACGESSRSNPTEKLGHNVIENPAKAPTCTEIGWEAYFGCSRCYESESFVEIPALGHDEIHHGAKEADCTSVGWEDYVTCSRCDHSTYVEHPALGHRIITMDTTVVDPLSVSINSNFELVDGIYYSTNHDNNSTSKMTATALYDCTLNVQYGVSSEQNYDKLYIYRNGVQQDVISGVVSDKVLTFALQAGDVITVSYTKDISVNTNDDRGWAELIYENVEIIDRVETPAENFQPDCTNAVVCDGCGEVVKAALGHTPAENGVCTDCEEQLVELTGGSSAGYFSLADAVALAVSGQTVRLLVDTAGADVILQPGVTLDLNGYKLSVNTIDFIGIGNVVDNSDNDTGILKIKDMEGSNLYENNSQLPIYDAAAGGYRFFEISVQSVTVTGKSDPKYWVKISAANFDELYKLIQAGSALTIKSKLTWNGGEADAVASAEFTQQWADAYNANQSIYITVSAVNTEGFENFSLIPCIEANGVAIAGDEM